MFLDTQKNTTIFPSMSIPGHTSSWVEIDIQALEHNLNSYKSLIHPALFAPVIKSNAYGHGIELVAHVCQQNAAVDMICVVTIQEALHLRSIGITKPLIVLSIALGDFEQAIAQNIQLIAYDINTIIQLNAIGQKLNKQALIHLKVDTGLSRLGVYADDIIAMAKHIRALPCVTINGIFTHLAESESEDPTFTFEQLNRFNQLLQQLDDLGFDIPLKHMTCSAATSVYKQCHQTLVRMGIGTYGLWPSEENKQMTIQQHPTFSIKPILNWKTKIIQIKDIPAGSYIGYDRTHQVPHASRIAILPVGYWDGLDRGLSNKGVVVINGKQAPIIGRIAMNLCMINITGLDVSINDEVLLLGNHPGVTAEDIARHCNTINYEVVTRINPLIPRIGI
jgi:alanine racemase